MLCEQDQSLHLGNIFPPAFKLQTGVVVKYSDHINVTDVRAVFLARRDKCPESYCRTPGVGVGVSVRVRVHKNFNLAYNS